MFSTNKPVLLTGEEKKFMVEFWQLLILIWAKYFTLGTCHNCPTSVRTVNSGKE